MEKWEERLCNEFDQLPHHVGITLIPHLLERKQTTWRNNSRVARPDNVHDTYFYFWLMSRSVRKEGNAETYGQHVGEIDERLRAFTERFHTLRPYPFHSALNAFVNLPCGLTREEQLESARINAETLSAWRRRKNISCGKFWLAHTAAESPESVLDLRLCSRAETYNGGRFGKNSPLFRIGFLLYAKKGETGFRHILRINNQQGAETDLRPQLGKVKEELNQSPAEFLAKTLDKIARDNGWDLEGQDPEHGSQSDELYQHQIANYMLTYRKLGMRLDKDGIWRRPPE